MKTEEVKYIIILLYRHVLLLHIKNKLKNMKYNKKII